MKKIIIILAIGLFLFSCIDVITSSEDDFYESVHIEGSGWFEFYQNTQDQYLELSDDFTFQVWFSGQEDTADEATCIISLNGETSKISVYRNPNINNMLMIYNGQNLIQQVEVDSVDFNNYQNFYLLSIIKNQNQVTMYLNDNPISDDNGDPLIIENTDTIRPMVGATLGTNPENLWYGYIDEMRLWNIALHDTVINFHNQYPTKVSSSYNDEYLESLNSLWDFRISMSETSISNVFQDINEQLNYTTIYTVDSMINKLSEIGR